MRTLIGIDDGLIAAAMLRGGHPTEKAAVGEGLRLVVRPARQREAAQALWGGDPDAGGAGGLALPPAVAGARLVG